MAYTINRFNGLVLTTVDDATINTDTDIKLVGKNLANYGEVQNENFVFLLENFSAPTPPNKPIQGQLWFDSGSFKIKVYDGANWRSGAFAEVGNSAPENLSEGDFWWNSDNEQLYAWNGTDFVLVGPQNTEDGITQMKSMSVRDTNNQVRSIIATLIGNTVVSIFSDTEFEILDTPENVIDGFLRIKKGITLRDTPTEGINSGISENNYFWGTASNSLKLAGKEINDFILKSESEVYLNADKLDGFDAEDFLKKDEVAPSAENANKLEGFEADDFVRKGESASTALSADKLQGLEPDDFLGKNATALRAIDATNAENADKLDGFDAVDFLLKNETAQRALNADLFRGFTPDDFLRTNETANSAVTAAQAENADTLDGLQAADFMQIAGGTFEGFVFLPADPEENNHAATKKYVDETVGLFNRPGQVAYFATESAPEGWLKANGALVSRTTYSRLFAAIGTRFGEGDGETTFALPDLRGEFIRGLDDGKGIDENRTLGSLQNDEFRSHSHSMSSAGSHTHSGNTNTAGRHSHRVIGNNRGNFGSQLFAPGLFRDDAERPANDNDSIEPAGEHSHSVFLNSAGNHIHSIQERGGNETRPRNIALLACISF
jgi:microcystin-dependent protein